MKRNFDRFKLTIAKSLLSRRAVKQAPLVISSSPRSGSTLMMEILNTVPNVCSIFEPLHLRRVVEAETAGFSWRTYKQENEHWESGRQFLNRVHNGKILNNWTLRDNSLVDIIEAKRLVIKFVRMQRLLPWYCAHFKDVRPVTIIRHPCAVIASQLNYGFASKKRPDIPTFARTLPKLENALMQTQSEIEFMAATWALDQLPILLAKGPKPWELIIYEELIKQPAQVITQLFESLGLDIDPKSAIDQVQVPSSVVSSSGISGLNGWQNSLTEEQIYLILSTVRNFGITFYNESIEPDYQTLKALDMSEKIQSYAL